MLRSLSGTVTLNNFSLGVVQVMHDGSRMMSKEISPVIDGCTLCVYLCNNCLVGFIPQEELCESAVCWVYVIRVI